MALKNRLKTPIMRQLSDKEIEIRLRLDNPWWQAGQGIDAICGIP
jgi:hypothetical protein